MNRRKLQPFHYELLLILGAIAFGVGIIWAGCPKAHGAVIVESAVGGHVHLATLSVQPSAGTATQQPETRVVIRRITDAEFLKGKYTNIQVAIGSNVLGLTNGYSRFECVSPDSKTILAFGTTPYSILHDLITYKDIRSITSGNTSTGKVGDSQELKWNPMDGKLYYVYGSKQWRQDALTGVEELVFAYPASYHHTSDGSFSADGKRLAMALQNGTVVVLDVAAKAIICTVNYASPNGVDVSPSGKFLKIDNKFYDVPSGAYRNRNEAGHGGWSLGKDGREWFVNQNSRTDWIEAFDPQTSETLYMMRMGPWHGMHAASDKAAYFPGHSLISTYRTTNSDPTGNNVFFLELKSQKPGLRHPYYGGTTTAEWNAVNAPVNMFRVCHMQNLYISGKYFTEGFASVGPDLSISWGGNWNGTDNLELYRAELPDDLKAALGVAVPTPSPTPSPTPTQTPVPTATPNATPLPGGTHTLDIGVIATVIGPAIVTVVTPTPTPTAAPQPTPTPEPVVVRVELHTSATIPQWGISNYPLGAEGFQQNFVLMGSPSLGNTTRGNYCPISGGRNDYPYIVDNVIYDELYWGKRGIHNIGQLQYWNTSMIPNTLKITGAWIGLYATDKRTEFGNHPTGKERVPIKQILNPLRYPTIWTNAFLRPGSPNSDEKYWDGASFHNWYQHPSVGVARWSNVDIGSPTRYGTGPGRYGPLVTVLKTAPGDPEISFAADGKSMSVSSDITELVQGWIDGTIPNWGVFFDAGDCRGTDYFGTPSNPRPLSVVRVGIMTPYQGPATAPRLIIEYQQ